ncbi:DUF2318 domain-containing protein [Actinomyces sp. zg328]|uniref:DUF2318 domain-containing protein n=1 Tax=Actinomyces sp. zg328 TaxID=2609287 RepID=UPI0013598251|nr:DUF2318 domain-containing protein [Actinomyces sp. zg328]
MLERFAAVVGGMTLPFLLYAALAVVLVPPRPEGWPLTSRARLGASALGLGAGIVFAWLRASAAITSRTAVNIPAVAATVIADGILLIVLAALVIRPRWGHSGWTAVVANASACAVLALAFFRAVPEMILQLTAFIKPGEEVLSSQMLLRILGFSVGWAAVGVLAFIYYRAARRAPVPLARTAVLVLVAIVALLHATTLARMLHSTRRARLSGKAFRAMIWVTNNDEGVILIAAAAVLLIPMVVAFLATLRRIPEQGNPALRRREIAGRRRTRRWVIASGAGLAALVATRTVLVRIINEVPTLSDPEPYTVSEGAARIDLAKIADGHLHRYAYTAAKGTEVRFLVILKNGGSYGVGLDACISCGPAGYYEKDGKVICKRCDVAINPATIGFKGGCNPIPIDFTVDGGSLTITTDALEASAEVFA